MDRIPRAPDDAAFPLPLPVASFLHRAELTRDPRYRHDAIRWAWETSVRIGAAFHGVPESDRLQRPTLGVWVEALMAGHNPRLSDPRILTVATLFRDCRTDRPASVGGTLTAGKLLGAFTSFRNTLAHGGPLPEAQYDVTIAGTRLLEGLVAAWREGVFLPLGARLLTEEPLGLTPTGSYETRWIELCGTLPTPTTPPSDLPEGPRDYGIAYVHANASLTPLAPWIVLDRTESEYHFLFFDGSSRTANYYKDLVANRRVEGSRLVGQRSATNEAGSRRPVLDANPPRRQPASAGTTSEPRRKTIARSILFSSAMAVVGALAVFALRPDPRADSSLPAGLETLFREVAALESDPRAQLDRLERARDAWRHDERFRSMYAEIAETVTELDIQEFLSSFSFALGASSALEPLRRQLRKLDDRLELCERPNVVFFRAFLTYLIEQEHAEEKALVVLDRYRIASEAPIVRELRDLLNLKRTPFQPLSKIDIRELSEPLVLLRAYHLLRRAEIYQRNSDFGEIRSYLTLLDTHGAGTQSSFPHILKALLLRLEGRHTECLAFLENAHGSSSPTSRAGILAHQTLTHLDLARRKPTGSSERAQHVHQAIDLARRAISVYPTLFPWLVDRIGVRCARDFEVAQLGETSKRLSVAAQRLQSLTCFLTFGTRRPLHDSQLTLESYATDHILSWAEPLIQELHTQLQTVELTGLPLQMVADTAARVSSNRTWLEAKQVSQIVASKDCPSTQNMELDPNRLYLIGVHIVAAINVARSEEGPSHHAKTPEMKRILGLARRYHEHSDHSWAHEFNAHYGIGWANYFLWRDRSSEESGLDCKRMARKYLTRTIQLITAAHPTSRQWQDEVEKTQAALTALEE